MTSFTLVFFACFLTSQVLAWEALPTIPTGRRSQFLVLQDDGAYKYGYDTGDGHAAKQEGDPANQVQGHYFYKNAAGRHFDLKYTSGVQGFQPEGLEKIQEFIKSSGPSGSSGSYLPPAQAYSSPSDDDSGAYVPDNSGAYNPDESGNGPEDSGNGPEDSGAYQPDNSGEYSPDNSGSSPEDGGSYQPDNSGEYKGDQGPSGDASYNFNVDTASYKRTETSDAGGNIQGSYSYNNNAGTHDLQYVAGAGTGFVARSGSLSKPNGLRGGGGPGAGFGRSGSYEAPSGGYYSGPSSGGAGVGPKGPLNPDGSYSFGFSTGDQSRDESGDTSGNVRGRYSFRNSAGNHDLSYKAGAETGFLVTGGSLAQPNGLPKSPGAPSSYSAPSGPSGAGSSNFKSSSGASGDGSYSFGFSTGDQDRQEDSDASGNVRGRFSYRNSAGNHDLSYVAGSATGFLPTGGSLANPNGLGGGGGPAAVAAAPASGYSYVPPSQAYSGGESQDDQADSGDSSYNFNFDTPEYTRQESSDARGNVRGSFTYRNSAGSNDLSFVAGSATGFQPTGGSLSVPNGLGGRNVPGSPSSYNPAPGSDSVEIAAARSGGYSSGEASSGDASYNFAFDTDEYKRQEASDVGGNVRGSFSYKNSVGNHDLSFVAGSATGFKPTGGSLSVAPGLSEAQLRAGFRGSGGYSGGSSVSSRISSFVSGGAASSYDVPAAPGTQPDTKTSYRLGNVKVHTYLPPSNVKHKYGYIFDTQ